MGYQPKPSKAPENEGLTLFERIKLFFCLALMWILDHKQYAVAKTTLKAIARANETSFITRDTRSEEAKEEIESENEPRLLPQTPDINDYHIGDIVRFKEAKPGALSVEVGVVIAVESDTNILRIKRTPRKGFYAQELCHPEDVRKTGETISDVDRFYSEGEPDPEIDSRLTALADFAQSKIEEKLPELSPAQLLEPRTNLTPNFIPLYSTLPPPKLPKPFITGYQIIDKVDSFQPQIRLTLSDGSSRAIAFETNFARVSFEERIKEYLRLLTDPASEKDPSSRARFEALTEAFLSSFWSVEESPQRKVQTKEIIYKGVRLKRPSWAEFTSSGGPG